MLTLILSKLFEKGVRVRFKLNKIWLKNFLSIAVGAVLISAGMKIIDTKAQSSNNTNAMPTSGNCGFMINLPLPYGIDVSTNNGATHGNGTFVTGGSIFGTITFTSATAGTFSGSIVNPTFVSNDSPAIYASDNIYFNNGDVTITPMTAANGFVGGYRVSFSGRINGGPNIGGWEANVIPTNSGKTLLIQLANSNANDPRASVGPGSGICQL
jgi:hypothetical protein